MNEEEDSKPSAVEYLDNNNSNSGNGNNESINLEDYEERRL
jgi:hypothetical protein